MVLRSSRPFSSSPLTSERMDFRNDFVTFLLMKVHNAFVAHMRITGRPLMYGLHCGLASVSGLFSHCNSYSTRPYPWFEDSRGSLTSSYQSLNSILSPVDGASDKSLHTFGLICQC